MGKQYGQDWSSRNLLCCSLLKKNWKQYSLYLRNYVYYELKYHFDI